MRLRLLRLRAKSLRATLIFDLTVIGITAAALFAVVLGVMIRSSFGALESVEIGRDVDRARAALSADLVANEAHVLDWGLWDETFFYLRAFDRAYEDRNINAISFENAEISCAAFLRLDRSAQRAFCFDPGTGAPDPDLAAAVLTDFDTMALQPSRAGKTSSAGYWQQGGRLFAVASTPVRRSDGSGTAEGLLVFLHLIEAATLSQSLQVPVRLDFSAFSPVPVVVGEEDVLDVAVPVAMGSGPPMAMLRFQLPRLVLAAGERLRDLTVLALLGLLAALMALLGRRLSTQVLAPILAFRQHVVQIRQAGELVPIEGPPRTDEIGALHRDFNEMAAELEALRLAHAEQSFALGREQNATGLLHNLRNSLSPVRVILADLERHLLPDLPPEAGRARQELADPLTADDRRRRLVAYLEALDADRDQRGAEARALLQEAGRSLTEALEAMRAPRDPARVNRDEACDLGRALGHAATAARFVEGPKIDLSIDCPPGLQVRGNRVLLAQILENLVVNATEAIAASGRAQGRIAISVTPAEDGRRCSVTLADDGDGFDAATGARLFERGFSTRTDKHGGLGLHWCANTLSTLGGALSLTSPGKGLGAVARLDLPLTEASAGRLRPAG
ncbi:sensor histidine kinase [Rhodobacter capsulatus]|jgi:signal transduction histidine kinase|uniref:histidine kinase n=2 Tax=Rhodobacter capsulatus TaxID=1061 RepID=D5ANN2_RHOCB|nr:CHASE4 domain-containing protein [Rhodobacter capsulatus]ADE84386.1 signal transduction histidine kinase [Rhodobacter capsulatus SB 1003]ETD02878.1 hypothetical protein U714_03985 [Rhodobacter capsulatus DE442]ETD79033.1 hypothetical protein U717_03990 [Rhodobacter capsulatus R121]ETE54948.1 hypothetical protein U715_03980 [Rhodobacter capsulatus Y262]MDS0926069.1 ATP-binding protein [Rhodobacter capsulatus]